MNSEIRDGGTVIARWSESHGKLGLSVAPDKRELPCDCGGEFFLALDCGEVCHFTCNECGKTERVAYYS